jgi:hypothetical protein
MQEAINPINITGAALITQFSLITIMFIGAIILRSWEQFVSFYRDGADSSAFAWIILVFALVRLAAWYSPMNSRL